MSDAFYQAMWIAVPIITGQFIQMFILYFADRRAGRKLDVIHELTNSTLAAAHSRIQMLETIVTGLTGKKAPE